MLLETHLLVPSRHTEQLIFSTVLPSILRLPSKPPPQRQSHAITDPCPSAVITTSTLLPAALEANPPSCPTLPLVTTLAFPALRSGTRTTSPRTMMIERWRKEMVRGSIIKTSN
ncbi:unnamed protein product [Fusarium graminearum]|nr:unnamed protein product [Fusarium graminearum]